MKKNLLLSLLFLLNCTNENLEEIDKNKNEPVVPQAEYTKQVPGEWKSIASDHLPIVEYEKKGKEQIFNIKIPGKTFHSGHSIEKIGIMDRDKMDIVVNSIQSDDVPYKTVLSVNGNQSLENAKIFVKCNLHDLWTIPVEDILDKK